MFAFAVALPLIHDICHEMNQQILYGDTGSIDSIDSAYYT